MTESKIVPLRRKKSGCPICDKPTVHDFRPFCSKRCADRDLGKWLKEDYRLPTDEVAGLDGEVPGEE